jgi:cysteinyl-tRNA synthetase
MTLTLYNTLSRREEAFEPIDPQHVRLYVCGPTVYDYVHIGNARPVVVFDVLYRLLQRRYARVTYVRNITDIDDKIMERAKRDGVSIGELTQRTGAAYQDEMRRLGALPPTVEPRATQYVAQMIAIIEKLMARGHAYVAEGQVLFSVPSLPAYGELSRRSRDEQIDGARVDVAPYKKDPADFTLWKPSTPDQPGWDSPWGRGRPGWHIECSAMSAAHLGETFDIHAGGLDLVFPHHENEIAQSRGAFGTPYMARVWMHNGWVLSGGEKMSKSLGNFFTVNDLLQEFPGEAIRLLLLKAHYRQPLDFTRKGLVDAKAELDRFYRVVEALKDVEPIFDNESLPMEHMGTVEAALSNDLNTPQALAVMHSLASYAMQADLQPDRLRHVPSGAPVPDFRPRLKGRFLQSAELLGLLQQTPDEWFRWAPPAVLASGPSNSEIEAQLAARKAARAAKNFAEADRIRDGLKAQGVLIEDGPQGATWRRA